MTLQTVAFGILIGSTIITAQTVNPAGQPSIAGRQRQYPPSGTITLHPHPGEEVISLDQMVAMSSLIIEGTVTLGLQPINRNPKIPYAIQTDSMIAVQTIIAGAIPSDARTILLTQEGGKVGSWETLVPDDPLVKTGEHYILFLAPDKRTQPANTTGLTRYHAVGIWAGKVKVENGKVHFLPRAAKRFKDYDSADLNAFLARLKGTINRTIVPDQKTAIPHPGLGTITAGTGPAKK